MIELIHQCGHCSNWNFESHAQDGVGQGFILSPVHQARDAVERLDEGIRRLSMFDPQYYLPRSQKSKLHSYEFFPDVAAGGFDTVDFHRYADTAARRCLEFQVAMEFPRLISPIRYVDQLYSDFIESQEAFCVRPFVEAYNELELQLPIYQTLVLTPHMVRDEEFSESLLDWLTSVPELTGVYLIPDFSREIKPVTDADAIFNFLKFASALRNVDLDVLVGYTNVEGLLFTLVNEDISVATGAFENTRMFSLDKFVESDERRHGPKPRVFLEGLLNWVRVESALEIRQEMGELWEQIYFPTPHSEQILNGVREPHFMNAGLYKHYFQRMGFIVSELNPMSPIERYEALRSRLKLAERYYDEIEAQRIDIDRHGSSEFVFPWLSAINKYARSTF